jgi:hypothetical protein
LDTQEQFEVWTDHENLKHFRKPQKLNGWQMWWYLKQQDYDFIIKYMPGKSNTKADILSWRYSAEEQTDQNITFLLEEWFINDKNITLLQQERFEVTTQSDLMECIQNSTRWDTEVTQKLKEGQAWEKKGIVYVDEWIYLLPQGNLQEQTLQEHYDPPDIGHPG